MWMNLEVIMLSEVIPYHLTSMWNLKIPSLEKQSLEWWLPGLGLEEINYLGGTFGDDDDNIL